MNQYAKIGKKYLKALDVFFKTLEKSSGHSMRDLLSRFVKSPTIKIPAPKKAIDSLDMLCNPDYNTLHISIYGHHDFDGYCSIFTPDGKVSDEHLRVFVSDMGAWQLTLLAVMDKHVLPVYWHACYMKWKPILSEDDLQKLRKSKRQFSTLTSDTYEFLPKDLPAEPTVMPIEEGKVYQTIFYAWSDFAGYLKITSTITFPKGTFVLVNDVDIKTEIESIVPYRAPVML